MQIDPRDACMPPVGAYRKAAAPTTRLRRLDSRTIKVRAKDGLTQPGQAPDASNRLRPAVPSGIIGSGTWEGAHAWHEAAGVRQPARRRGRGVADPGARAAIEDTGNRISVQWSRRGLRPPGG